MTEDTKTVHEKALKNKTVGEAQLYCRLKKLHCRWIGQDEEVDRSNNKRLTFVVDRDHVVRSTFWG